MALGAVALGLIVTAAFLVAFPLTGAALNLSRVFGPALVANEWADFGWYALGMLGGAVAGLVYEYVFQTPGTGPVWAGRTGGGARGLVRRSAQARGRAFGPGLLALTEGRRARCLPPPGCG